MQLEFSARGFDFVRLQQSRAYDLLMRLPLLGWSMFCATLQMAGLVRYVREADAALLQATDDLHREQFITEPVWAELARH